MPTVLSRKPGGGGGGGAPSGPAGGDLTGTYPNPTIDSDASGAGEVLTSDGAGGAAFAPAAGGGLFDAYAQLEFTKAQNTDGGDTSATPPNIIPLAETFDPSGIVSVAANQFTLQAGSYFIDGWCSVFNPAARHQPQIYNVTDAAIALLGASGYSAAAGASLTDRTLVRGRVTIASAKAFEMRITVQTGDASDGLGVPANFGVEHYGDVMIYREA